MRRIFKSIAFLFVLIIFITSCNERGYIVAPVGGSGGVLIK